jgi:hypothetical protein
MLIYKNFLSEELFFSLEEKFNNTDVEKLPSLFDESYKTKSNDLYDCIVFRIHKGENISYKEFYIENNLVNKLKTEFSEKISKYKTKNIEIQYCIWHKGSSLKMHYDSIYKYAGTIYFNEWEKTWGGLFEYKTKYGQINTVCPEKNLLVFNNESELHQVTKITDDAKKFRKSIQIWFKT